MGTYLRKRVERYLPSLAAPTPACVCLALSNVTAVSLDVVESTYADAIHLCSLITHPHAWIDSEPVQELTNRFARRVVAVLIEGAMYADKSGPDEALLAAFSGKCCNAHNTG